MAKCLDGLGSRPRVVLDYGCGTGSAIPFLREFVKTDLAIGVDPSTRCLDVARRGHGGEQIRFHPTDTYRPSGDVDLVFCNGVFHHIPPGERASAAGFIHRALRPGGMPAFWENNPWNPGTRYVMSRIPFDRDAIPLSPPEARHLLGECGLEIIRIDFLFLFPRCLGMFRFMEPSLSRFPLGAQYQILCRKPGHPVD